MATSLLPKNRIGIKKTTINSAVLRELKPQKSTGIERIGPKTSFIEKLTGIRNFHIKRYESNLFTFKEDRKRRQEERIKEREAKIERPTKRRIRSIGAPAPAKSIFDSIGNFLLFTAGGILFNRFADLEKSLGAIQKTLEVIGKGIEIVSDIVGNFTNFIDSAVKGYDDFLQKIEDVSGFDKKKIEKFMEDFKYVINGAVIAAILTVRALPLFVSRFLRNRLRKPPNKPPKPSTPSTTTSRMTGGSNTGIDYRKGYTPSGQRLRSGPSISRFNNSMAKYLKGTADPGDMARLFRRGFFKPFKKFASPLLKKIPIIGFLIDFLVNYFIFKEPIGKSAFIAASAGLGTLIGGALGTLIPIPGAGTWIGSAVGGIGGEFAGRALYDVIFGEKSPQEISSINEYADYDLMTEINNIYIQPVET